MNPTISIIVPSYNEEKNIKTCLDSILNQTFSDFEVLCVDDGSTDSTYDILVEYSKKDSRIIPLKNNGKGVSSARNTGLKHAKGQYIGFVDSDDCIQPQMYEFLYNSLIKEKCNIAVCNFYKSSEFETKSSYDYKYELSYPRDLLLSDNKKFSIENEMVFSSVWTKLINRNLLNDVEFENHKIGEDTVFCSNIWKNVDKFCFINLPLYCYIENKESVTRKTENYDILYQIVFTIAKAYENLKFHDDSLLSSFYLDKEIKYLLSLRFSVRKLNYRKEYNKNLHSLFKKYFLKYLKCKDIGAIEKVVVFIFYLIPPLYSVYRKTLDKTL